MSKLNRKTTAEQASEGVDLAGKHALVTGANTGLGKETARVLALRGATVTMACRDMHKAEAARSDIVGSSGGAISTEQLELLKLDMNSLAAVRKSASDFVALNKPLHILINNAGIMIPMERRTEDAFEAHLGINHLAHFLFTNLLLEPLRAAGGARVVMVSSAAMMAASLTENLHDLNWQERKFSGMKSYGDSKLMNLMFAREFNGRYTEEGIVANALHPGVIGTELARDQSPLMMAVGVLAMPFMKSIPQGAATSIYVATAPQYQNRGGLYFNHCNEVKAQHKLAASDKACADLWRVSASLTGYEP
ncbi:MAG: SDR family oxidoreductase [Halioglobus sp.]